MFHLHRLEPEDGLPGGDRIADRGPDPDHRPGHRGEQRTRGDVGGGFDEPGDRPQPHRAERRVHVHRVAVPRDVELAVHAVDREHHPALGVRDEDDAGVVVGDQAGPGEPVPHLVCTAVALVPFDLRLRRQVAPAARHPA
ncbi:hypothetical protein GQ85_38355, partial [Rhodococcus rhodochrous]